MESVSEHRYYLIVLWFTLWLMLIQILQSADHLRLHQHNLSLVSVPEHILGEVATTQQVRKIKFQYFLLSG